VTVALLTLHRIYGGDRMFREPHLCVVRATVSAAIASARWGTPEVLLINQQQSAVLRRLYSSICQGQTAKKCDDWPCS